LSKNTPTPTPPPLRKGRRAGTPQEGAPSKGGLWPYIKLARPHQWVKGVFVLVGPLYGLRDLDVAARAGALTAAGITFAIFALASSTCYVFNDILDAEQDRAHPRKRNRPIASGAVTKGNAITFALLLLAGAVGLVFLLDPIVRGAVALVAAAYVANVWLYSLKLKHIIIADVISLALGFCLRMFAGCAAVAIAPTTWLLNCTLFLAMFLAFGKRLGERRIMGADVASARGIQARYTDDLLRMSVVVTGVATLITYASYVVARGEANLHPSTHVIPPFHAGINVLWFTMVPATYALLRCIVLLESGTYDDPTELAARDLPMQLAVAAFGLLTLGIMTWGSWAPTLGWGP
jgi:decaprenyl-phosphate phosphoribosyltransferase